MCSSGTLRLQRLAGLTKVVKYVREIVRIAAALNRDMLFKEDVKWTQRDLKWGPDGSQSEALATALASRHLLFHLFALSVSIGLSLKKIR